MAIDDRGLEGVWFSCSRKPLCTAASLPVSPLTGRQTRINLALASSGFQRRGRLSESEIYIHTIDVM
jgi:hypothetical protein